MVGFLALFLALSTSVASGQETPPAKAPDSASADACKELVVRAAGGATLSPVEADQLLICNILPPEGTPKGLNAVIEPITRFDLDPNITPWVSGQEYKG